MSHTSGPWIAQEDADGMPGDKFYAIHAGRMMTASFREICQVHGNGKDGRLSAEDKDNLRLLAASTDMLDALKLVAQWFEDADPGTDEHYLRGKARAAISKAEGRS